MRIDRPQADEARPQEVDVRRRIAWLISGIAIVLGIALGDIAMVALVGIVRAFIPAPLLLQWLVAAILITVGGYLLFGLPQLRGWEAAGKLDSSDPRVRWAVRLVGASGPLVFVLTSVLGGPLVIGWYCGTTGQAHGREKTALAAAIMGLTWGAIYLGVVAVLL